MAAQDPRLAWTLLLRPCKAILSGPPPWPSLVLKHFGEVALGPLPSVQRVLEGPLPTQVLSRVASDDGRWVLSGLGRSLGITVGVEHVGEVDRFVPVEELRRQAIACFVGSDSTEGADLASSLRILVDQEPDWEFLGLIEVVASLGEGATPELPDENGWDDLSGLVLGRGAGTGLGHVAWELSGWYSGATERGVMSQRLQVLLEGHLKRPSALICFGAEAANWGAVVTDASRRAAALESVLDEVRLAASWAISGGPAVELDEAAHVMLSARLETLRVGLEEDLQHLRACTARLQGPVQRILGTGRTANPSGAFLEASSKAGDLITEFEGRVQVATRWSEALSLAGKLIAQRAGRASSSPSASG
jgi:hypothetical protein